MSTSHGHRHSPPGQHEHDHEPQHGLPEALPAGEHVLWQGTPDWTVLAVRRFHLRKLAVYFAALVAFRVAVLLQDGAPVGLALGGALPLLALSALGLGLIAFIAWLTARTTVYTLTDRRLVMRIGIVLTLTLNIPFKRIAAADLRPLGHGYGDLAVALKAPDRIAWLHLWPHARPWRLAQPEPALLAIADAAAVARRLTDAWSAVQGEPARAAGNEAASAAPTPGAGLAPPLAAH